MKRKTKYMSVNERRAAEHYEQFVKSAFGSACVQAKKLGWTWTFEGEMIWVQTGTNEIGCSGRLDFCKFVQESH